MSTKTRHIINISISIVLVAAFLLTFSWFYVSGSELRFLQDIPADCAAAVSIWSWSFDDSTADRNDYEADLTQEQLLQFFELLQSSSYWRNPSPSVTHNEISSTYTVFITYKIDGFAQYLSITSSGGYAVNIHGSQDIPFAHDFLMIRDKDWIAKLDAILASE